MIFTVAHTLLVYVESESIMSILFESNVWYINWKVKKHGFKCLMVLATTGSFVTSGEGLEWAM